MIDSILIANRGEIACRIIKTCRRLGIKSIAIYSEADANAKHVQMADQAVNIGPAEASKSYLNADAVMQTALKTKAKAIHPGYGFLSERVDLPTLCNKNDIVWIGPSVNIIKKMGSKIAAKQIAKNADVPIIPGFNDSNLNDDKFFLKAQNIGFPVLIKASAGGGGKGMRSVYKQDEFMSNLAIARSEALKAFGDGQILVEKLITQPRHLEVQILGDKHGNLVHLFERECSIQRNYQKVIEEAPAGFLDNNARSRLYEYALKIGQAVNYDSAGTVEFVFDQATGEIYFLEMNTRLQVEHTVTEQITGIDLVEQQILVATGDKLALRQDDIVCTGHAIEARVNSEDPANGYLPQIGIVENYAEPSDFGIRVDSGIKTGSEISPNYDSMLAKVIGYGASRSVAAERLVNGLNQLRVSGLGTNQAFLIDILHQSAFFDQALTTDFLSFVYPDGWSVKPEIERLVAALSAWNFCWPDQTYANSFGPWFSEDGFRILSDSSAPVYLHINTGRNNISCSLQIFKNSDGLNCLFESGETLLIKNINFENDLISVFLDNDEAYEFTAVITKNNDLSISWQGVIFNTTAMLKIQAAAQSGMADSETLNVVLAPMPGLISTINVGVGQKVKANDIVATMESMKLIHSLPVLADGVVTAVHCKAGDMVSMNMHLVEIEQSKQSN